MDDEVGAFFSKARQWQAEYRALRQLILGTGLAEELKWGKPCYTFEGKNVVLIHGFKDYCALLFHKGALLKDPKSILVQQTEHVQSARQIRFTDAKEIAKLEKALTAYLREAIEVEKAGLKVDLKKTSEFAMPDELRARLDGAPALKSAFAALTPGRQRAYILEVAGAKRAETREARIDKHAPRILKGLGLDD